MSAKSSALTPRRCDERRFDAFSGVLRERPAESQRLVVGVRQHGHQFQAGHLCDYMRKKPDERAEGRTSKSPGRTANADNHDARDHRTRLEPPIDQRATSSAGFYVRTRK